MLSDLEYMNRALDLAERGRGTTSPNPDGRRGGRARGRHDRRAGVSRAGRRSARRGARARRSRAISRAARRCIARSSRAATSAGRARASSGSRQPASRGSWRRPSIADPRVSGRGFEFLRQKGIDVSVGTGRERALRLNRAYFTFKTKHRPFVIMKAATSLDNRVAREAGRAHADQLGRFAAARARGARRGRRDRRRLGNDARRRSAADRARGASPPSADAGAVRSAAADRPVGAGVLDAGRGTGNNRHHAREHRKQPRPRPRVWSARAPSWSR